MVRSRGARQAAAALAVAGIAALVGVTATATAASAAKPNCSFTLRIGDVLPFTGGLAAYGGNMDKAVRLAISLQNAALRKAGLAKSIKVVLVDSQDGQTQATAAVEAAKKEVGEHVDVIIGEMASGATIPMAQSVTIPNHVVLISPTASAPQLTQLQGGRGWVWRTYPSDNLQGKVLAEAALQKFGKGATVNVGARNDAFGTALEQLFIAQWKALGGKVGVDISWDPNQPTFDTEAGQLVSGNPAGWVIIDFPETFLKFAPSLIRTGKWDATKTLMTEALKDGPTLDQIGQPVVGLSGTAASAAGGPAGNAFHALWNKDVKGAQPYTGFEGTAFDAANVAFLAALRACSASPAKLKNQLVSVSGPPGVKVTFQQMQRAITLTLAHKKINYEGAFSPVDFSPSGDISSAVYEIWQYNGKSQFSTLKTFTFKGK
ncbi:MAG: ABC transporter substrate-binding protein [Acidobacteriota bacterium]|nr:ABC transporter substrate-binding protein [Acidobacteriota bacterium]